MEKIDRVKLWVFIIIRTTVVVAGILAIIEGDWANFGMSVLTILVMLLPSIIEKKLRLDFPSEFDIIIVVFIYAAIFLGEINMFYDKIWWWDNLLHGFSGLILGYVGFTLVNFLNTNSKVHIHLSPVFVAVFSFCFTLAIGAVWEIYEYAMDCLFGFHMQRDSLDDTMTDLVMDTLGALAFSVTGYLYLKGKIRIIARFVERFKYNGNSHDGSSQKSSIKS